MFDGGARAQAEGHAVFYKSGRLFARKSFHVNHGYYYSEGGANVTRFPRLARARPCGMLLLLRIILEKAGLRIAAALACVAMGASFFIDKKTAGEDANDYKSKTYKNEQDRERDVHRVLGLLDYLCADYAGAVVDGVIASAEEYEEQKSFAEEIVTLLTELEGSADGNAAKQAKVLHGRILKLASASQVQDAARDARLLILQKFDVKLVPDAPPSFAKGRELFIQNCAQCHGERGDANTQKAKELKPPPLSFLSEKGREALSPYHIFNVVTFGVGGTAMASFDTVAARDRWSIAFYVATLRSAEMIEKNPKYKIESGAPAPAGLPVLSLHELANSSDARLMERLRALGRTDETLAYDIAWLRMTPPGKDTNPGGRLGAARVELAKLLDTCRAGKREEARRSAFDIYLQNLEPVEAPLRAADRELVTKLESGFVELRAGLRDGASDASIARVVEELDKNLVAAEAVLTSNSGSTAFALLASALIILREGIEASLLVAAMLGLLRKMARPDAVRSLHFGWIAALAAGLATWAAARLLISVSNAQRELVEGIVGLIAAAMLAYTSYWILSRADSKHWMGFLKEQLSDALSRRGRMALFTIAFLAVYREAFETVLFYEALLKEHETQAAAISGGALLGAGALAVAVAAIFKLSKKLPLKTFFTISGGLLYILAFIFAGSAIHALIEGNYLEPRPISFPRVEWLGLYPDLLSVSLQSVFVAAVAIGLLLEWRSRRPRAAVS